MFHFQTLELVSPSFYISILITLLMALDLNICLRLSEHLLPAAILDFISSLSKSFALIKVLIIYNSEPLQLLVRPFSDLALNLSCCCLFSSVLFCFHLSPIQCLLQLLWCLTSSVALTVRPSTNMSSAQAIYCLVLFKTIPVELVAIFLTTMNCTYLT